MSGYEVTRDDGQVYAVRLPEWLSADERRRIVAEANAFVAGMVQAISAAGFLRVTGVSPWNRSDRPSRSNRPGDWRPVWPILPV